MTRAGVTGAGVGILVHSSLFDGGVDDMFSGLNNTLAGYVDCDQVQDFHVAWGYNFFDSTAADSDFLRITMTTYARDRETSSAPCDFVNGPQVHVHDLTTGPPNTLLYQEAASLVWGIDGTNCVPGRYFQIRVKGIAIENYSNDVLADGCFMVRQSGANVCPGAGPVCI